MRAFRYIKNCMQKIEMNVAERFISGLPHLDQGSAIVYEILNQAEVTAKIIRTRSQYLKDKEDIENEKQAINELDVALDRLVEAIITRRILRQIIDDLTNDLAVK